MAIKVAINGFGRIGRMTLRAVFESNRTGEIDFVAINDLGDIEVNEYLMKHDTAHGPFPGTVEVDGDDLIINGDRVKVFSQPDPSKLPWKELGVDVVLECTGVFRTREKASLHLKAGAKKVLISAPAGDDIDATLVAALAFTHLLPVVVVPVMCSSTATMDRRPHRSARKRS